MLPRFYARLQYPRAIRLNRVGDLVHLSNESIPFAKLESSIAKFTREGHTVVYSDHDEFKYVHSSAYSAAVAGAAPTGASQKNIYLAAICVSNTTNRAGVAWANLLDGTIHYAVSTVENLANDICRIDPIDTVIEATASFSADFPFTRAKYPRNLAVVKKYFDSYEAVKHLTTTLSPLVVAAIIGVVGYAKDTAKFAYRFQLPQFYDPNDRMQVDKRAVQALELFKSSGDSIQGSVLSTIKRTKTASGTRFLRELLASPLRSGHSINQRLNNVEKLITNNTLLLQVSNILAGFPDGKMLLQKLQPGNDLSPSVLQSWAQTAQVLQELGVLLKHEFPRWSELLQFRMAQSLAGSIIQNVNEQLEDDSSIDYQPIFNPAIDNALVELYKTNERFEQACVEILERYTPYYSRAKIRYNVTYGYHIWVSGRAKEQHQAIAAKAGVRNSVLLDVHLAQIGKDQLAFNTKLKILEQEILYRIAAQILELQHEFVTLIDLVDEIDVVQSFATLAMEKNLTRPYLTTGPSLEIEAGRHISVEQNLLQHNGQNFVANDCMLLEQSSLQPQTQNVCMVTGPNMGGKSTFIRQTGIICILAQMGSFVPAKYARIGIVDKVLCRIGSGDDGYKGQSTFMLEMLETAQILKTATKDSLALLDEVGRGTSRKDGVAIAFATIAHLIVQNRCRVLFATHFGPSISRMCQNAGLHLQCRMSENLRMNEGVCDDSQGIRLAELAGFPHSAIDDAKSYINSG